MLTHWEVNGDRREIGCHDISHCVSETLILIPPTMCVCVCLCVSVCVASIAQACVIDLLLWCLQSTQTWLLQKAPPKSWAPKASAALGDGVASVGTLIFRPHKPLLWNSCHFGSLSFSSFSVLTEPRATTQVPEVLFSSQMSIHNFICFHKPSDLE